MHELKGLGLDVRLEDNEGNDVLENRTDKK
jgi:hypothetical protein